MIQVEAYRKRRPLVLSSPLTLGVILIALSAGPVMPLYCMAFVLSGAASLQNSNSVLSEYTVNQKDAEAIAFGIVFGYIVPSLALPAIRNVMAFTLWFGYHAYIAILLTSWRAMRPDTPQADTTIIKGLYALSFVATSITHVVVFLSKMHDLKVLKDFFVPPTSALEPNLTQSPTWDLDLFRWDLVLTLLAMMVATLWFAKDAKERSRIFIFHVIGTMTIGPSASVCGVLLWREICLTKGLEGPTEKGGRYLKGSATSNGNGVSSH